MSSHRWMAVWVVATALAGMGLAPRSDEKNPVDPAELAASIQPADSVGVRGAPGIFYSQSPNRSYAFLSAPFCYPIPPILVQCESGAQSVADNFTVGTPKQLQAIRFWGGYAPTNQAGNDNFTIRVFEDNGGVPGTLVYAESGTATTRAQTGFSNYGLIEWVYDATLGSGVVLAAGQTYWLEIYDTSNLDPWGWETGNGPGNGIVVAPQAPGTNWSPAGYDMAFELLGEDFVDCNTNGVQDAEDIASGASADCDSNGVPDECQGAQPLTALLDERFESGLPAGWTADGLWHVTDQCVWAGFCDPSFWAYFGLDATCDFYLSGEVSAGALSAPPVTLPVSGPIRLTYCSVYEGEAGDANVDGYDWAWVTVNGEEVDDAGLTGSAAWETRVVDLSAYAGQTVTLEWHFDSIDDFGNEGLGWEIDEVMLTQGGGGPGDCNSNGVLDACDIDVGTSTDCDGNGVPDECQPSGDCNGNGIPDLCDIGDGTSDDCNTNGVPDECEPSGDCNSNGVEDLCDIAVGTSQDCNGNIVPDECETDCNYNAVPDDCDIAAGTSEDCNSNGVPDECDVPPGSRGGSADCNYNGVPDECDVADGTSADCDGNGVPDECDLDNGAADCNYNGVLDDCDIAGGASADCNNNGVPDECDVASGGGGQRGFYSNDCNSNGVPDECEADCNNNGYADECDLFWGDSEDCNTNGIPDECDIDAGHSGDCQPNGIPDECEEDCNSNGLADECDLVSEPSVSPPDDMAELNAGDWSWSAADGTVTLTDDEDFAQVGQSAMRMTATGGGGENVRYPGYERVRWDLSQTDSIRVWFYADNPSPIGFQDNSPRIRLGNDYGYYEWRPDWDVLNLARGQWVEFVIPIRPNEVQFATLGAPYTSWGSGLASDGSNLYLLADGELLFVSPDNGQSWQTLQAPGTNLGGWNGTTSMLAYDANGYRLVARRRDGVSDYNRIAFYDIGGDQWSWSASPVFTVMDHAPTMVGDTLYGLWHAGGSNFGGPFVRINLSGGPAELDERTYIADSLSGDDAHWISRVAQLALVDDVLYGIKNDWYTNPRGTGDRLYRFNPGDFDPSVWSGAGPEDYWNDPAWSAHPTPASDLGELPFEPGEGASLVALPPFWSPEVGAAGGLFIVAGNSPANHEGWGDPSDLYAVYDIAGATYHAGALPGLVGGGSVATFHENKVFIKPGNDSQMWIVGPGAQGGTTWERLRIGSPVLAAINYLEIHTDTWDAGYTLWIDGVRFEPQPTGGSGAGSTDCNSNGIPDECDLADGSGEDCNTNGILDECDLDNGDSEDCNTNGVPDECDTYWGDSADCNTNSIPDECEEDCNGNGVPDDCDINGGASDDCQPNGVPDECEPDCNTNGVADDCDISGGASDDCQPNGVPDECEPDCNTNGVADDCDISGGASDDCQPNGIPDECETDCNTNGVPDACDISTGTSQDCTGNGIPDECEPDCNGNGAADSCDLSGGASQDCNGNGVPDECDLSGGTSQDCNANGVPDECDIAGGAGRDCNGNGIPDECDLAAGLDEDCNSNTVLDDCDIATGVSVDCQLNDIPDECDIAAGTSDDCNANGAPDECDLMTGLSADCNGNSVPDECDAVFGSSDDCNGNLVPDECELADGSDRDCNGNGVLDACDIQTGFSLDCQPNGIPDECDIAVSDYFADFQAGAGPEWSLPNTDNTVPAPFTRFSGRFDNQSQTLTVDTLPATRYLLTFDLYIIDSWDGNGSPGPDYFNIYIDGAQVFHRTFPAAPSNPSYLIPPDVGPSPFGWSFWNDTIYRSVNLQFDSPDFSTQITFQGQGLQGINDESWGIDNVRVMGFGVGDCNTNGIPDACDLAAGVLTDLNANAIPDECETIPAITAHAPSGAVHTALDHLDVTFSEVMAPASFTPADVSLIGPDGAIPIDSVSPLRSNAYRISFAAQTVNGDYTFTIGPDILDLVGTAMDAPYQAVVTLSLPDLAGIEVTYPAQGGTGQPLAVTWTVANVGIFDAIGSWVDSVYLSSDAAVGGDVLLGSFSRTGPLAPTNSYTRTQSVNLPVSAVGAFWIIVIADAADVIAEPGGQASNAVVGQTTVSIADVTPPTTTITGGPAQGSFINVTEATFNWTGSDNISSPAELEFAYCLATATADCDPPAGAFGPDVTATFTGLTEADSPYTFKVTARDPAGNVNPAPATRSFTVDQTPPMITSQSPESEAHQFVCNVRVTFSEPVSGFGVADVALTGPSGPITVNQVADVGGAQTYEIRFACQSQQGTYMFTVGPNIADRAGNPMTAAYNGSFDLALPDLVVTDIVAPPTGVGGRQLNLTWTVTNNGPYAAIGAWQDRVWLSLDNQVGSDTSIATFTFTGELAVGQSYTRTDVITIPVNISGQRWFVVETDRNAAVDEQNELNNATVDDASIDIAAATFPDLAVESVVAPAQVFSGQSAEIQWAVRNIGNGSTAVPSWTDRIVLSSDAIYGNGDDRVLGSANNPSYLGAGDAYSQSAMVTMPIDALGQYYVFVRTDVGGAVAESNETNNTSAPASLTVQLTPPPDLQVVLVQAPSTAFSGEFIAVSWTVQNLGTGPVESGTWTDRVYLSSDQAFDAADALLGSATQSAPLAVGQTYTQNGSYYISESTFGDYYVLVVTDAADTVFEPGFNANNVGAESDITTVVLTPPADLAVGNVFSPSSVIAGQPLSITYSVTNEGARAASGGWQDALYLSADSVLDTGADILIGAFARPSPLEPGQSYTATHSPNIPGNLSGAYYVFVFADRADSIFEYTFTQNNVAMGASPVQVMPDPTVVQPVDLQATSVTAPASAVTGETVTVQWVVTNAGPGVSPATAWSDRIYLSSDQSFGNDILLSTIAHQGLLPAGESYSASASVVIPQGLSGPYYFIVLADAANQVYEHAPGESNNATAAGAATAIALQAADLTVSSVQAPQTADEGQSISVTWTVVNNGAVATNTANWIDRMYLSQDTTWDGADRFLGSFSRSGALAVSESYNTIRSATIPYGLSGVYYVLIVTDATNAVIELNDGNNTGSAPMAVDIEQAVPPNLVISYVDAPASAASGQVVPITYEVRNAGAGTTFVSTWYDAVYLSLDLLLDTTADRFLGTASHDGYLSADQTYANTIQVTIPAGFSGPYYVFVVTDSTNRVVETGNDLDNRSHAPLPVNVYLPPPADLVVDAVSVPATGSPGLPAAISWTVRNASTTSAITGSWYDSAYLSLDSVWDISDKLIARVIHTETSGSSLDPGETYTGSANAPLPGVTPGRYAVIIRTDILNHVIETNETNNRGSSEELIDVDVVELTLGDLHAFDLSTGQSQYFKVNAPPGETLTVTLDAANNAGSNELYMRFAEVPSRVQFEFSHGDPFGADQAVTVPTTQAGSYYILVYGDYVPGSPQPHTILADSLPFGITGIAPATGSNAASATVRIRGAQFEPDTDFSLLTADQSEIQAAAIYPQDASQAFATFDLQAAAVGPADVTATNPDQTTAAAPGLFEIVSGGEAQLSAKIVAPSAVRAGFDFTVRVEYANVGLADMPAPVMELRSSRPMQMSLSPTGPYQTSSIRMLGVNYNGPAGILPGGAFGFITVYFRGASVGDLRLGLIRRTGGGLIDWDAEEAAVRSPDVGDLQWQAVWNQLKAKIGDTWSDYEQAMANVATRLWQDGDIVYDVRELFAEELAKAWDGYSSYVSGVVVFDADSQPAGAVKVQILANAEDPDFVLETTTDINGAFEFKVPTARTYKLFVGGFLLAPLDSYRLVAVPQDQDVRDLELRIVDLPPDTGPPPPPEPYNIPDQHPYLARDAQGAVHMVWNRGPQVWHATFDGSAWQISGPVRDIEGTNPRITRGPSDEGPDAVTVAWQAGDANDSELRYAVGRMLAGQPDVYQWSDPIDVTGDAYADYSPALLAAPTGELMLVWLKSDTSITDDSDLYYQFAPVPELTWSLLPTLGLPSSVSGGDEPLFLTPSEYGGDGFVLSGGDFDGQGVDPARDENCFSVKFDNYADLLFPPPKSIGLGASFKYCSSPVTGCEWSQGGQAGLLVAYVFYPGRENRWSFGGSGNVKYIVDPQACDWIAKRITVGLSGSGEAFIPMTVIPTPWGPIPVPPPLQPFLRWYIQFSVNITSLVWEGPNFELLPSSGKVGGSLGAGIDIGGDISELLPINGIKFKVGGRAFLTVRVDKEIPGPGQIKLTGTIRFLFRAGAVEVAYEQTWDLIQVGFRSQLAESDLAGAIFGAGAPRDGVTETVEWTTVTPPMGTGMIYPGQPLLGDVTTDLWDDSPASLAVGSEGEILAVWTKDSPLPETYLGQSVVLAEHRNGNWSAPVELAGYDSFNQSPQIVVDDAGDPMAVWSTASTAGLSLESDPEAIFDAMGESEIVFSRRVNGVWSAPAPLATIPGADSAATSAAGPNGAIVAAWLHTDSGDAAISVYAALWDGNSWSTPSLIAMAPAALNVACEFSNGHPMVVWSADGDGDLIGTPSDQLLYYSIHDGASWSSPVSLPPEIIIPDPDGGATQRSPRLFELPPVPPQCCHCETDAYCDDGADCTDDACVNNWCVNQAHDERCDTVYCDEQVVCNPLNPAADAHGCAVVGSAPCSFPLLCDEAADRCVQCFTDADCDDYIDCTDNVCIFGTCEYRPDNAFCDDGDPCTPDECTRYSGCVHRENCDDDNPCTIDTCHPVLGCVYTPNTCDDQNPCTVDSCERYAGGCKNSSMCDDGDKCTTDPCDPQTLGCLPHEPVDCDDGDPCTNDSCNPALGCVHPSICDDNNACTIDICDPGTLACSYQVLDCNDDNPCTNDSCNPAFGCVNRSICYDGNACTRDICDPDTLECSYSTVNCNDSSVCTIDSCDPQFGCRNQSLDCDDHNVCTVDSCDARSGCIHTAIDCGPGNECLFVWCDPTAGCRSQSLDCNDGPPIRQPIDPNEKVAPAGYGPEQWVAVGETLLYTIFFENKPDATASAQVVTVTDDLSPSLDWRTFRLRDIGFGSQVVHVPDNRSFYQTSVDLIQPAGLQVRIDAGINIQTGQARWALTTIDPATGELPADQTLGFLPPNDPDLHNGEGYVTFTIRPAPGVSTGTVIANASSIVFDVNEPLDTNPVSNTVDADLPQSAVATLPAEVPRDFAVQWSGSDPEGGSGLASFGVYVSENGGAYALWTDTAETSGTFSGQQGGSTYTFYSLAADNAGNVERAPTVPDATTTLAAQTPVAPVLGPTTYFTIPIVTLGTSNLDHVEHAVFVESAGMYVGADGRLTAAPFWQRLDAWNGVVIADLAPGAAYTIRSKARSATGETELSPPATATTTALPSALAALALHTATNCVMTGATVEVTIDMALAVLPVAGGEFYLSYDPNKLTFVGIAPGDAPFDSQRFVYVDAAAGTIDFAVGGAPGAVGTTTDSLMAVITFTATGEVCATDSLVTFRPHEPPTQIGISPAGASTPNLENLPALTIDGTAPSFASFPADMTRSADARGCTASLAMNDLLPTATDNCPAGVLLSWVRSDSAPALADPFPVGTTTVMWTAADACGNAVSQTQSVTIEPFNDLWVDVELSPALSDPNPGAPGDTLTRCIRFELWECPTDAQPSATIDQEIAFPADGGAHLAADVSLRAPCGNYTCITARDPLHSLRTAAPDFTDDGVVYTASFAGNVAGGGHRLTLGNLNDDIWIDIIDFALFVNRYGTNYGAAGTTCQSAAPHADISGNGLVALEDFTFIQINFLRGSDPDCCGLRGESNDQSQPVARISVEDLQRRVGGGSRTADFNGDGWVDQTDVVEFLRNPPPQAAPLRTTPSMRR